MSSLRDLTTKQLERIIAIKKRISRLETKLATVAGVVGFKRKVAGALVKQKRKFSAAARKKIAAAARARWAAAKRAGKNRL